MHAGMGGTLLAVLGWAWKDDLSNKNTFHACATGMVSWFWAAACAACHNKKAWPSSPRAAWRRSMAGGLAFTVLAGWEPYLPFKCLYVRTCILVH